MFSFHPEAENELNNSIDYYEQCKKNLGLDFANEVYKTIQRIINYPDSWQKLNHTMRRCLMNRFPFAIIYKQQNNKILILAIMQLNRKPNYWKSRTKK